MPDAPHKPWDENAADGEADGPTRPDPAQGEWRKPFDLPAHRNEDSVQPASHHQEDHAEQQGEEGEYLPRHGLNFQTGARSAPKRRSNHRAR